LPSRRKLHIVADNYATHKHPEVQSWLAKNPRISLHVTLTSGRGCTFTSVKNLIAAIKAFVYGWNDRRQLFTGTGQQTSYSRTGAQYKNLIHATLEQLAQLWHVFLHGGVVISRGPFTHCESGMPKAEGPQEDRDEVLNPAMERRYTERRRRQMGRQGVDEDPDQNVDHDD